MFRSSGSIEDRSSGSLLFTWDVIAGGDQEETGEKQLHEEVFEEELDNKLGSCVGPWYDFPEPVVEVWVETAKKCAKCRSVQ